MTSKVINHEQTQAWSTSRRQRTRRSQSILAQHTTHLPTPKEGESMTKKRRKTRAEKIQVVKDVLNAIGSWARNIQDYEFEEEKPKRKRKR